MARKKPTVKEMEKVVNLVINQVEHLKARMINLEIITDEYYSWKNEKEQFKEHLDKKLEEAKKSAEDATRDSLRDNGQQKILTP